MIGDRVKCHLEPSGISGHWHGEWVLYRFLVIPRWSISFGSNNYGSAVEMVNSYDRQYRAGTLIPSYSGFWKHLLTDIRLIPEHIRRRRRRRERHNS